MVACGSEAFVHVPPREKFVVDDVMQLAAELTGRDVDGGEHRVLRAWRSF